MARPVQSGKASPGIVTYTLTGHDEFVVLAASWFVTTNTGGTPPYWFDFRDPNGGIIAIQCVGQVDNGMPTLVTLGPGSAPAATVDEGSVKLYPTAPGTANNVLISPIMEAVPLGPNCTVNAYVAYLSHTFSSPDPMVGLDTGADPHNLHLWVEDTQGIDVSAIDVGPYMLVPGQYA